MDRLPLGLRAYRAASFVALPLLRARNRKKLAGQNVPPARLAERDGYATAQRPPGQLIWLHGASVGETLSLLPVIDALLLARPALRFLVTSGTASAAQIMAQRLPEQALHQFAPLDSRTAIARFLAHWQPDLAVLAESEIWPNTVLAVQRAGIPLALINARLSARSASNWQRFSASAARLFGAFDIIFAQDQTILSRIADLGAQPAHLHLSGNLKALAAPLPYDAALLEELRGQIGARPIWLAASTHDGEEALLLVAHSAAQRARPDLLMILAPRHPERAAQIVELIGKAGHAFAQRSAGGPPGSQISVYLADTLGEMGLWYRLAPLTFLAGSLGNTGGHNPFEAAQLGTAILHGPNVVNAAPAYAALAEAGATQMVETAAQLGAAITTLLSEPSLLAARKSAATGVAMATDVTIAPVVNSLLTLLDRA